MDDFKNLKDLLKTQEIKNTLKKEAGFRKTIFASGPEKLVKPLVDGRRVEIKCIKLKKTKYDIDLNDPDLDFSRFCRHTRDFIYWKLDGSPDNSIEIPTKKIMKNPINFDWVKYYEKKFELICDRTGRCKYIDKKCLKNMKLIFTI